MNMKHTKKILIGLALGVSLMGCGFLPNNNTPDPTPEPVEETEETEEPEQCNCGEVIDKDLAGGISGDAYWSYTYIDNCTGEKKSGSTSHYNEEVYIGVSTCDG